MTIRRNTLLRPAGYMIGGDRQGRIVETDTLQCVHCGAHFGLRKKGTGYCHTCGGPICGVRCAECVPQEQQLENIEAGRGALEPRRILVPVVLPR